MKNIFFLFTINFSILFGQFSYPAEDFLGGGIGYSPMYIKLESIPGADSLVNLGLDPNNFADPFVVHGGEGFAHVTGRWRIGGYAGMGGSSISTIPTIKVYVDTEAEGWQSEETQDYTDDFNPSIKAKFSFLLGAASVEYVMPLLQDLELSSGALMGLGRVGMAIDQQSGNPRWDKVFSNAYGTMTDGVLYYPVLDINNPDDIIPGKVAGLQRDVSAIFFNFQPYIAVKWQFLERLGLRISVGANKGTVNAGSWKLNGRTPISDSPKSSISGITFRTMLYIGL
ncbi:hypothetical protein OAC91_00705 [Candidatus Marinimicrobia bacterium]|jgi:hypothetical protein|nr:hypothetical protein [Candidatus Neomarinimicrobiota bacterium]|tara:strand:+ start:1622 stop:2470 length:849 start_codon:yes stop_codon:yes gene_type:complete